jgi:photosystem II stability/assembly factor-like uncharacterized protein
VGVRSASLAAAAQSSVVRVWPLRGRLSLGALGLALVLAVSVAWGTGLFYLLARLGTGSPVRLASLDGIHAYVGVAGGVFILAKVLRVGLRHRVEGVPGVMPWQRWLSWSMLMLYSAVFVTGVLLLVPIRGRPYADLVQLHLLTSVWALLPTTWHVWHYRARATPYVRRWASRLAGRRFWIGLALVALPLPVLLADAPAVSQLPAVRGGAIWSPVQPLNGDYLDAIAQAPDGTLVAAGDAIYISRDGVIWLHVDVPAYATATQPGSPTAASNPHAGHEHGQPAPPNPLTALAVGRSEVFAGSSLGLFATTFDGQIRQVAFPGGGVRGVALDPSDQARLWVTSAAGPFVSSNSGESWSRQAAGLSRPSDVSAVAFLGPDAYVSDGTGVFRWAQGSAAWTPTSSTPSVELLSPSSATDALYASTESTDLQVLANGRWTDLGLPAPLHLHHGVLHGRPAAVRSVDGRLYAAGTPDGVSASADGGRTWTQLGGGLGTAAPNQLIGSQGTLWVATSDGLFRFPLATGSSATPSWWAMVLVLATGLAIVAVGVGALDPRRRRRRDNE